MLVYQRVLCFNIQFGTMRPWGIVTSYLRWGWKMFANFKGRSRGQWKSCVFFSVWLINITATNRIPLYLDICVPGPQTPKPLTKSYKYSPVMSQRSLTFTRKTSLGAEWTSLFICTSEAARRRHLNFEGPANVHGFSSWEKNSIDYRYSGYQSVYLYIYI